MGSAPSIHVRVLVQGELGPTWSAMFSDLAVEPVSVGATLIDGDVPDQAALHGLLAATRDLGLSLIALEAGVMPEFPGGLLQSRPQAIAGSVGPSARTQSGAKRRPSPDGE